MVTRTDAELRWERTAASSGIIFVVLVVVSLFLAPLAPPVGAQITDIMRYYSDHRAGVVAANYMTGLAVVLFLWFLGSLRAALARAEGGVSRLTAVAFGAGIIALAFQALAAIVAGAIVARATVPTTAFHGLAGGSDLMGMFSDLTTSSLAFTAFPVLAFLAAASLVMLRSGVFPRWLGIFGFVAAFIQLLSSFALFVSSGPLSSNGIVGMLSLITFLLWVLAVSVLLVRMAGRAQVQPAATGRTAR